MPSIMKPVRLPRDPLSLQAPSPTFIDSHGDWHELELEQAIHVTLCARAAPTPLELATPLEPASDPGAGDGVGRMVGEVVGSGVGGAVGGAITARYSAAKPVRVMLPSVVKRTSRYAPDEPYLLWLEMLLPLKLASCAALVLLPSYMRT